MRLEDDMLRNLGQLIRQQRKKLNLTQEELAHRARLHRTYIGDIERGSRNVAFKNLMRLCWALKVHPGNLFSDLPWPAHYAT